MLSSQFAVASISSFFFFNDTATTEIYTLSLHDALPISRGPGPLTTQRDFEAACERSGFAVERSEEHTSELQSQSNLVCRLLLEKKKTLSPTYLAIKFPIAPPLRRLC